MNAISAKTLGGFNLSSLPLERKLEIKNIGRPNPEINIKNHEESVTDKFAALKEMRMDFSYKLSS